MPFLSPHCSAKFPLESFITCLKNDMSYVPHIRIQFCIIEPGAYATGFNKINYEKKYVWMKNKSYFKDIYDKLKNMEDKFWNLAEVKRFDSIIAKYIRAALDKEANFRYTAHKY